MKRNLRHILFILKTYKPGVRGAFSSLNSFIYCGAGVNGPCAAGVPNTIRNGVESRDIARIRNEVQLKLTIYVPGDYNKRDPERENWPCRVMLPILPIQSISGSRLL